MWACAPEGGTPNRQVCERVLRHAWSGGLDANEPTRLSDLRSALAPQRDPDGAAVKAELRTATDEAVARGIFGVPTIEVDGRLFWGLDALDMLAAYLRGDPWFESGAWEAAAVSRAGVTRKI
jgi:2-hydroxychromene-2-carboxylate isomerase